MVLQSYKTLLVSQKDYINKGKVMKFDPSIPFIWFLSDFPDTKKLEIVQQSSRLAVTMKLSGMVDLKGAENALPLWHEMNLRGRKNLN